MAGTKEKTKKFHITLKSVHQRLKMWKLKLTISWQRIGVTPNFNQSDVIGCAVRFVVMQFKRKFDIGFPQQKLNNCFLTCLEKLSMS